MQTRMSRLRIVGNSKIDSRFVVYYYDKQPVNLERNPQQIQNPGYESRNARKFSGPNITEH